MAEFCPHCGEIGGLQQQGNALICGRCGQRAGTVPAPVERVVVDQADELIRQGAAARCPACQQLVEVRGPVLARHFAVAAPRKLCPGSGKPPVVATQPTGGNNPMTRESIRVVSCRHGGARIEELTLAYLDRTDRVRLQIDALRAILGAVPPSRLSPVAWAVSPRGLGRRRRMRRRQEARARRLPAAERRRAGAGSRRSAAACGAVL